MFGLAYLAKVFGVKLVVDGNYVSGRCTLQDAGVNFTVYFSHTDLLQYMLFKAAPNSYHHVWGSIIVSAYLSSISNRPAYSVKMNVQKIGVARIQANGTINLNDIHYDVVMDGLRESPKFKLLLTLYLLQVLRNTPLIQPIPDVEIDMDNADEVELGRVIITTQQALIANGLMDQRSEAICGIEAMAVDDRRRRRRPGVMQANETLRLNPMLHIITMDMLKAPQLLDNITPLPQIVPLIAQPAQQAQQGQAQQAQQGQAQQGHQEENNNMTD